MLSSNPMAGQAIGDLNDEQRAEVRHALDGMVRERAGNGDEAVLNGRSASASERSSPRRARYVRRPFARAAARDCFETVRQRLRSSAAARLSIRRSRCASSAWRLR